MTDKGISKDTIIKIAKLARLELSEKEISLYSEQLQAIIGHVSQLSEVNTEGVLPLVTATDMVQTFSDDSTTNSIEPGVTTSNAPERSGHLFKVPPVL